MELCSLQNIIKVQTHVLLPQQNGQIPSGEPAILQDQLRDVSHYMAGICLVISSGFKMYLQFDGFDFK